MCTVPGVLWPICILWVFHPFQIENRANSAIAYKTHPNINRELFNSENILSLKDPNRPFPTGQAGDAAGVGLLKWRMQSSDESMVPLSSRLMSLVFTNIRSMVLLLTCNYRCSKLLAFCFWKWNLCKHWIWGFINVWSEKCCDFRTTSSS